MTIEIKREPASRVFDLIEEIIPLLVFNSSDNQVEMRKIFVKDLLFLAQGNPNSLLFITAFDENSLAGFIIAIDEPTHIWIAQAWSKPGNLFEVIDSMFARVILWAVGLGKSSIRAETVRNVNALYRRFGFTERATILEKTINADIHHNLIQEVGRCVNGRTV